MNPASPWSEATAQVESINYTLPHPAAKRAAAPTGNRWLYGGRFPAMMAASSPSRGHGALRTAACGQVLGFYEVIA